VPQDLKQRIRAGRNLGGSLSVEHNLVPRGVIVVSPSFEAAAEEAGNYVDCICD
jgi:hypothetical protein